MFRLSNERTILEIRSIVLAEQQHLDATSWLAAGAAVRRERHRYSGQPYAFSIEVLDIRFERRGRCDWHVLLVTEQWQQAGHGGEDLRFSSWLKLLQGTNGDIVSWIRTHRPLFAERGTVVQPEANPDSGE